MAVGPILQSIFRMPFFLTTPRIGVPMWLRLLTAAVLMGSAAARGAVLITISEQGEDVVATGSGSLQTAALFFLGTSPDPMQSVVNGGAAAIVIGNGGYAIHEGASGPSGFGTVNIHAASISSGDLFGVGASGMAIVTPFGYTQGELLSATSVWSGTTIAGLGLTPGTYTWTWGQGPDFDSLTVEIVPEPSAAGLLGTGLLGFLFFRRRPFEGPPNLRNRNGRALAGSWWAFPLPAILDWESVAGVIEVVP